MTAATSSCVPVSAATADVSPAARWRWMFSTMTIASSMTRPMAMARPPSDIRLIVPPARCRMKNVPTIVSGSEVAAIEVTRQSRRNADEDEARRASRR